MIVVLPTFFIVTFPALSTVATLVSDDAYVTVPSPVFVSAFVNAATPYILFTVVFP